MLAGLAGLAGLAVLTVLIVRMGLILGGLRRAGASGAGRIARGAGGENRLENNPPMNRLGGLVQFLWGFFFCFRFYVSSVAGFFFHGFSPRFFVRLQKKVGEKKRVFECAVLFLPPN